MEDSEASASIPFSLRIKWIYKIRVFSLLFWVQKITAFIVQSSPNLGDMHTLGEKSTWPHLSISEIFFEFVCFPQKKNFCFFSLIKRKIWWKSSKVTKINICWFLVIFDDCYEIFFLLKSPKNNFFPWKTDKLEKISEIHTDSHGDVYLKVCVYLSNWGALNNEDRYWFAPKTITKTHGFYRSVWARKQDTPIWRTQFRRL